MRSMCHRRTASGAAEPRAKGAQRNATCSATCPAFSYGVDMDAMPHILVVDDDREIRDLLARFLERHRLRVTAVRDGREARRAWTNGHYQQVVLDLMLPGETGLDLARWMRSQSDIPTRHADRDGRGDRPHHRPGARRRRLHAEASSTRASLLARIRAVLRRAGDLEDHRADPTARALLFNGWTLEPGRPPPRLGPGRREVALTRRYRLRPAAGPAWSAPTAVLDVRDNLLDLLRGRQAGPFDQGHRRRHQPAAAASWRMTGCSAQPIKTVRGGGYVLAATVERRVKFRPWPPRICGLEASRYTAFPRVVRLC